MNYTGINHLALATADMEQTIRFWRDLLGMRLIIGTGRPGYRQYFFEISPHDTIAFFEWPDVRPIAEKDHGVPAKGPFAFDHVSLGVETDEDLWRVKDTLEAAGVWVSEVVDHGFIHSVYAFDPNHIPIEFSAPAAGIDCRKRPVMTDISPTPAAREGDAPQPGVWPPVTHRTPNTEKKIYPGEGDSFIKTR
ncbi:VOC family protein [Desulfococcus sp.]|uniref:VOC family protein n=1 Tax=Desulfococcus sp. TaxID=2025834 RepID=UPI003593D26C